MCKKILSKKICGSCYLLITAWNLGSETAIITRSGNNLYEQLSWGKVKLYAETPEKFYVQGMSGLMEFKRDDKNKITGFDFIAGDIKLFVKKND